MSGRIAVRSRLTRAITLPDVSLIFQSASSFVEQLLRRASRPARTDCRSAASPRNSISLQREQRLADLADPLDERQMLLRLPRESLLQLVQHRLERCLRGRLETRSEWRPDE